MSRSAPHHSSSPTSASPPSSPETAPLTLGATLQSARQKAGFSVEEIARVLRLRPAVVRELENDDLRSFDHASYARMTILGYARALRLPEETIRPWLPKNTGFETSEFSYLDRLAASDAPPQHDELSPDTTHRRSGTALGRTLKVFLSVIVLLAAGYGYLLWRNLGRLQPTLPQQPPAAALPTPSPDLAESLENMAPSLPDNALWREDVLALDIQSTSLVETANEETSPTNPATEAATEAPPANLTVLPALPALPVLPALPAEVTSSPTPDSSTPEPSLSPSQP